MKIRGLIEQRYIPAVSKAAGAVAKQLPLILDTEVARQLHTELLKSSGHTGEVSTLTGYLIKWRNSAVLTMAIATISSTTGLSSHLTNNESLKLGLMIGHAASMALLIRNSKKQLGELSPLIKSTGLMAAANLAQSLVGLYSDRPLYRDFASEPSQVQPTVDISRIGMGNQPMEFFDWQWLESDRDAYPHLWILGQTGSGKTYLAERIIEALRAKPNSIVITPKRKQSQWSGMKVLGHPRLFEAIETSLQQVVLDMEERMKDLDREWQSNWIIVDELPAIANKIERTGEYLSTLIREARETRYRLVLLTQGYQVKFLGLEGQSDLRENLCIIRLGNFAVEHSQQLAKKHKLPKYDAIRDYIMAQKRPIMVGDWPARLE